MKIIDLLNKIANGEEVPKKIKYRDWLYEFEKDCNDYFCIYDSLLCRENDDVRQFLNDEVEILEEPKGIPKRIQSNGENLYSEYIGQWLINKENYTEYDELLMNKINEIIDYLESKGESND